MEKELAAAGVELATMMSFGTWVSVTTKLLCHDREIMWHHHIDLHGPFINRLISLIICGAEG